MKICSVCKVEKPFTEYHKNIGHKDDLDPRCKLCKKQIRKNITDEQRIHERKQKAEYRAKNRDVLNAKNREYEKKNKEKIALRKVKYRDDNKEQISAQKKIYHASVRQKRADYQRNKRNTDLNFRLKTILRNRVSNFLNGIGGKQGSAVKDLGCTIEELRIYIESKFKPGMTWENYGITTWHIDHIIPLANFDLTNREEFLKACHYTNLQPLWAEENWKKNRFYK